MTDTPISLLERLRQPHDTAAWSQFVHLYTPLLYCWARRTGLSKEDAADLLQDVFTILVQQLPAFEYHPGKSFRAWLRTILLNRWRTLRRHRQPQLFPPDNLDDLAGIADPEPPGEAEERRQLVQRALALLESKFGPTTWQAFRECVVQGRPAADVAAELGLSINAVYLARSRVLKHLREQLEGLVD
jgi:RNA polymerase sigma-70 factor (ECF subfamily)